MIIRTLSLAALAFASTVAVAGHSHDSGVRKDSPLADMVSYLESRYGGQVVAIALDGSGDKPAHYHVDLAYPKSGVALLDVDAATRAIASRDEARALGFSLEQAVAKVTAHVGGDVTLAEVDATLPAHYDVDVRLPGGDLARLKVDATSGRIDWRTPAIASR
jgi:uncharacterized membrane protein YkoI